MISHKGYIANAETELHQTKTLHNSFHQSFAYNCNIQISTSFSINFYFLQISTIRMKPLATYFNYTIKTIFSI